MVLTLVLFISIAIIAIDITSHIIPNPLTLALGLLLLVNPNYSSLGILLIEVLALATLGAICNCGAGDIKLLLVLLITNSQLLASQQYLNGLFISILVSIAVSASLRRSLQGRVPFAPAILMPFIWCYLAI